MLFVFVKSNYAKSYWVHYRWFKKHFLVMHKGNENCNFLWKGLKNIGKQQHLGYA